MEIHRSAFKHSVSREDIELAVRMSVLSIEIDDDHPKRTLHLAPTVPTISSKS
jgi:hypothetical protein